MNGEQRIEAGLGPDGTRDIPAVICYEGIYTRDHWDQLTDQPWWAQYSGDLDEQVAWRGDVIERTGQDWFYLHVCASRDERSARRIEPIGADAIDRIDERTDERERIDRPRIGGWSPTDAIASINPLDMIETETQVDERWPTAEAFDAERFIRAGHGDLAARMLAADGPGAGLFPITHVSSPLWSCYALWGFDGMMMMVLDQPDLVAYACRRHLDHVFGSIEAAKALGARGIWIEECMTDMVSPDAFAQLNVPYLKQIVAAIRDAGMKSIYYFCGDPSGKWDMLMEVGADALSLEESKKGFEIDIDNAVERTGGRCALLGNVDAIDLLETGSEAEVRAELSRQIDAGRRIGGRFVMSIGSPVTPDTSVERVRDYCDWARELGRG
ncbi:MAG: hypothetical protein CMJ49_08025 [Planctomycetaceae bacterium]|nr:hypothetical protein [Planctomycetaceae bacterium]